MEFKKLCITGRKKIGDYFAVKVKEHPNANKDGYIYEHRFIMEQKIGRFLKKTEFVHHINGDKSDNRITNLIIMNKLKHVQEHLGKKTADFSKLDNRDWVYDQHIRQSKPVSKIAREIGCSYTPVYNALVRHNIKPIGHRTGSSIDVLNNKPWLENALKERSTRKIANELGCSQTLVRFHQQKHNIKAFRKPNGK